MRQLNVFWNDKLAGHLTELAPNNGYLFEYNPAYLNSDLPHVSLTLPKAQTCYKSKLLFPFFANMLPEGALRRLVCREHHLDENDLFGILSSMTHADSIGAVSLKNPRDEKE